MNFKTMAVVCLCVVAAASIGYGFALMQGVSLTSSTSSNADVGNIENRLSELERQALLQNQPTPSKPGDQDLGKVLSALENIQSRMGDMEDRMNSLAERGEATPLPESSRLSSEERSAQHAQQQEQSLKLTQIFQDKLVEVMQTEPVDDTWAPTTETYVEQAIAGSEALDKGKLVSAECRTSLCRVEVLQEATSDPTEQFEFENYLLISMTDAFNGGTLTKVEGPDGVRYITHFAREGYELPKVSAEDLEHN